MEGLSTFSKIPVMENQEPEEEFDVVDENSDEELFSEKKPTEH